MSSWQITGKGGYGDIYIGHRTDTPASAVAKFIRYRYSHLGQRYVDRATGELYTTILNRKSMSLTYDGWSIHLIHSNEPPTRR